jgi:hypothetical protein
MHAFAAPGTARPVRARATGHFPSPDAFRRSADGAEPQIPLDRRPLGGDNEVELRKG